MALADLLVRIGVDTAAFSSGLERFNSEIGKSAREAEKRFGNIARAGEGLQGIGVGLTAALSLPLAGFATAATKAFAEIDSLKRGLFTLEKSAQGTERRFKELQQVAALPGLGLEEAVRGDIRLRAIGLSSETSKRALLAFGNALASVGSGKADLDETIRQFGQLATASTLTAENLKPIIERVPQAAQILRAAFGTANAEQLRDLGVTSQQVVNTLITELEKLPPVTGGIKNALENFSDSTKIALASAGEAIAPFVEQLLTGFSAIITKIPEVAKAFQTLPDPAKAAGLAIAGAAFVGPLAIVAIGTVLSNLSAIATAYTVIKTSAAFAATVSALGAAIAYVGSVAGLTAGAMGALNLALGPGAWIALAGAVGVAGNEILKYREAVNLTRSLEEQQARGQAVLLISLRQAGVAVDELVRQKNAGIITEKQYQQAITQAAIALGNQRRAAAEAASGANTLASANDAARLKFLELGKQVEAGKISADAFFAAFQKASGLDKAKLSAEEFRLKISELDAKLTAGKITNIEYALAVDGLRQAHVKAASAVDKHNKAKKVFVATSFEELVALAQQNIVLAEQRKNIEDVAKARLALSKGVSIDFGDIPEIQTKIKISEIEIPPFDELNDLNRTITGIDLNDQITKASQIERNKRTEASIKKLGDSYKIAGSIGKAALSEVSTVITNLSQGIGQAIVNWKGFGDTALNILKQTGAAIISNVIQNLIKSTGLLDGFSDKLKGVIKNIGGGASSGVSTATGSAGSAAGGAASAATSSIAGIVGAVGSVVSAVSGVIGNFQTVETNKSLDRVVLHTLQTANDLANLRRDNFEWKAQLFAKIDDVFGYQRTQFDALIQAVRNIGSIPVSAAVVGGGSTNNFTLSAFVAPGGEAQFFDWFAAELRRRRLIP